MSSTPMTSGDPVVGAHGNDEARRVEERSLRMAERSGELLGKKMFGEGMFSSPPARGFGGGL